MRSLRCDLVKVYVVANLHRAKFVSWETVRLPHQDDGVSVPLKGESATMGVAGQVGRMTAS